MFVLIALSNGDFDHSSAKRGISVAKRAKNTKSLTDEKVHAADHLIHKLKNVQRNFIPMSANSTASRLPDIIEQMQRVSEAYIEV